MTRIVFLAALGGILALSAAAPAAAASRPVGLVMHPAVVPIPVAEGCGWGRWRGPWGGCRDTPYAGPLPGGGWVPPAGGPPPPGWGGNGCPPGSWRGPWGHCRDTPYQGPLPGGGWR